MSKKKKDKSGSNNIYALTEAEQMALDTLNTDKLKTIVGQYKNRDDELGLQVKELQRQVKKIDDDNLLETKSKEEQIKEKEDEVVSKQKSIFQQNHDYNNQMLRFDDEKEREFRQLAQDKAREVSELKKKIDQLLAEKAFLLAFPHREKEYLETIQQLEQDQVEAKKSHAEELQKYERNFVKQKRKIDEDQKEAIQKIRREALEEANKKIRDAEQTAKENAKLNQDLELHRNELQQLEAEKEQIELQNNAYKRSLNQNHEGLTEYQTLNHKQAVKHKKLLEKVAYLTDFLEKESGRFQSEIGSLQKSHQSSIAEMEYEEKCLSEALRRRRKDIKEMKGISQMILDQRSDIEQYFLEALDYIKDAQAAKIPTPQQQQKSESSASNSNQESKMRLPSLLTRNHKHSMVFRSKIDVSQLDEEDKEKILRLVFQRMNAGTPPTPWRQLYDYNALNEEDLQNNVNEEDEHEDMGDSRAQHDDSHMQLDR